MQFAVIAEEFVKETWKEQEPKKKKKKKAPFSVFAHSTILSFILSTTNNQG